MKKSNSINLSYEGYLHLDQLLNLQKEKADPAAEDELLFIIIHQTYELWFKQLLHESVFLCQALKQGKGWQAAKKMRRMLSILKVVVNQTDVLETMTPRNFACFRSFLKMASGLQSYQFREIEILCGWRHENLYKIFKPGTPARRRIEKRLKEASLWECFCDFLRHYTKDLPAVPRRMREVGLRYEPSEDLQKHIAKLMQTHEEIDILVELFVDFDEGLQEWRYRHIKMVERTIGGKTGTGGSKGVEYLQKTLYRQAFPDLWQLRNRF